MDYSGTILKPIKSKGEIAVLNPACIKTKNDLPWPFLYRVRRKDRKGEYSTIDLRWLISPTELSKESRTIIFPERDYEIRGCEDPRITKINNYYYITYIGFDGTNARIALARTKDFKKIEKLGVIGPQIPLEYAMTLVKDSEYVNVWNTQLGILEEDNSPLASRKPLLLQDKDATLHRENKKWILIHRLDPHIQIATARSLKEFQNPNYWINYLKNIKKHELAVTKGDRFEWTKIGLGSPITRINDEFIALYHGVYVDKEKTYVYMGSFFKIDKKGKWKLKSRLKDPLFKPSNNHPKYLLEEFNEQGEVETRKRVYFPTVLIQDPKNKNRAWTYSGAGDKSIVYRSIDLKWLSKELKKKFNKVKKPKK